MNLIEYQEAKIENDIGFIIPRYSYHSPMQTFNCMVMWFNGYANVEMLCG